MSEEMKLFQISCDKCGGSVGFDIPTQTYRCTHCGQISHDHGAVSDRTLSDPQNRQELQIHAREINCPSCGATAEFDPDMGSYHCPYCDTFTDFSEVKDVVWKRLNAQKWDVLQQQESVSECSACGAKILFKKGEASKTCRFCGSNMIKETLLKDEALPEYIIPFVLTKEEAKKQLLDWADSHGKSAEANRVRRSIDHLHGYYLPYQLIRGPLEGVAYRDMMSRKFSYRGFLDYALINTSGQLNNIVLDAAEPFDLSQLRPFEVGYVGGHQVKLGDISEAETQRRTIMEAEENYRPYVSRVLHHHDVEVHVDSGEFSRVPILLPMYVIKTKSCYAVVNGQTGKTAVESFKAPRESKLWLIEPSVLTLLAMLITGIFFSFYLYMMLLVGVIAGLVFFTAYGQDRNGVLIRKIYKGEDSSASRKDGELVLNKGEQLLKNAFPNTPVFYENDGQREAQVEMKFYSPGRILSIVAQLLVMIFLPAILASIIHFARGGSISTLSELSFVYGGAWYFVTGGIAILYFIRGFRWDLFNKPILYEILPDGKRKLFGSAKSRRITILGIFDIGSFQDLKELGGIAVAIIAFLAFVLLGSTMAIVF